MLVHDSHGRPFKVTLTNVRYVPGFAYTLISVSQLWREHRIDSVFQDARHLLFPDGRVAPFDPVERLPSVMMVSTVEGGDIPAPATDLPNAREHSACPAPGADDEAGASAAVEGRRSSLSLGWHERRQVYGSRRPPSCCSSCGADSPPWAH